MKFRAFRCKCGYMCATAEDFPVCHDCGASMSEITDEAGKAEFNRAFRPVLQSISGAVRRDK